MHHSLASPNSPMSSLAPQTLVAKTRPLFAASSYSLERFDLQSEADNNRRLRRRGCSKLRVAAKARADEIRFNFSGPGKFVSLEYA